MEVLHWEMKDSLECEYLVLRRVLGIEGRDLGLGAERRGIFTLFPEYPTACLFFCTINQTTPCAFPPRTGGDSMGLYR